MLTRMPITSVRSMLCVGQPWNFRQDEPSEMPVLPNRLEPCPQVDALDKQGRGANNVSRVVVGRVGSCMFHMFHALILVKWHRFEGARKLSPFPALQLTHRPTTSHSHAAAFGFTFVQSKERIRPTPQTSSAVRPEASPQLDNNDLRRLGQTVAWHRIAIIN